MKPLKYLCLVLAAAGALFAGAARADLAVEFDGSFWWVIQEQNENGIMQVGTLDDAAQEASGFNLKRLRVSLEPSLPEYHLYSKAQVEFSEQPMLLDGWISWQPLPLVGIYVGQMKIPAPYETLQSEYSTDFITRSAFAQRVDNFTLAMTPYESPLTGLDAHLRDVGIAVKGSWDAGQKWDVLKYFLMVSNGLGANLHIGGNESPGFIISNNFGDYLYGARVELSPFEWLTVGGYYDSNVHHNMLFRDKATVLDLDRTSWDTDLQVRLPWGFRAAGMYGEGTVNDDWLRLGKKDYEFTGWEARLVKGFFKDRLEFGARFDNYTWETLESGIPSKEDRWTYGINWNPVPQFRMQLNYLTKTSAIPFEEDLKDNIVFLNIETDLEADLQLALKPK